MFPYPSGAGLHVGHPEGYTATDIVAIGITNQRETILVWHRDTGKPLARAIGDTALLLGLRSDWLNAGPASLAELGLPIGAVKRAVIRDWGSLRLRLASRIDQISFKLYAAVDQGPHSRHFADLRRLAPTPSELIGAARWARTHDPSDAFRNELIAALADLGAVDAEL